MSILFAGLVLALTACIEGEGDPPAPDEPQPEQAALTTPEQQTPTPGATSQGPRILSDAPLELDEATLAELTTVTTAPGDVPRLELLVDGERRALPLEHTHVRAGVSGSVARVEVTQTYQNPLDVPIEAVYVFPLPENAAVDAMRMVIGERVVEAEIQRRAAARQIYEQARSQGHTAALLEQERPNVFTQSVANIAPGESIEVVVGYVQDVTFDDGGYEFVFPMVVGPRYVPGEVDATTGRPTWVPDTSQVPDWQRITPPVLGRGLRTGHDISLELVADVGIEVADIRSPTHEVAVEDRGDGRFELVLAERESQPNRDFVARYRVAGAQPLVGLVSHKASEDAEHGYFSLMLQPPALELDALVGDRELIFVVDVSGSMSGQPLSQCKQAMRQLLAGLRPSDTFNVITFSGRDTKLFEHSVPVNDATVRHTIEFLEDLQANGGTNLGSAVEAALGAEPVDGRNRYVFFMTDAQVGQEDAILGGAEQLVSRFAAQGARARVFSFGVGYHPNQFLIESLARVGDGLAVYATAEEDPARAVNRFFGLIDHPVMEHLWIEWGGLPVETVQPVELPDLFASRPLVVHGRYGGAGGQGEVIVHGRIDGEPVDLVFDVALPAAAHGNRAQATLWARSRIADFERDLWSRHEVDAAEQGITELALEHGIVTKFTSFVAVDRTRVVGHGDPTRIDQPTEPKDGLPETVLPDIDATMVEKLEQPVGIDAAMSSNLLGAGGAQSLFGSGETFGDAMDQSAGAGKPAFGFDSLGGGGSGGGGSGNYGLGVGRIGGLADKGTGGGSGFGAGHGSFGTAGRGGGGSGGRSYGKGEGKLGDKSISKPKLKPGRPEVTGSLDKRIVRKVISKRTRAIKNCYERQLLSDPSLAGKIVVQWTLDATGAVSDAAVTSDTMGSSKVGECLERVVRRMRFPAPKGGGSVTVSYPFVFDNDATAAVAQQAELAVTGTLTTDQVSEVLAGQRLDATGCRVLDDGTRESGTIVATFTVDAQGFTSQIAVVGDSRPEGVESCLSERVGAWRFPASQGTTLVETPL